MVVRGEQGVTERWDYNEVRNPKVWTFDKGIFLEQFDEKFHVEAYIQADTAYNYFEQKKWELRGRVRIRTKAGLVFTSEELFWDQERHEMYSNKFSRIVTIISKICHITRYQTLKAHSLKERMVWVPTRATRFSVHPTA